MIFCSQKKKTFVLCRLSKLISKDHESDTQVWFIIYSLITFLVRFHSGLELVDCLSLIYSLTKICMMSLKILFMSDEQRYSIVDAKALADQQFPLLLYDTKLQSRISIVILIPPCFAA